MMMDAKTDDFESIEEEKMKVKLRILIIEHQRQVELEAIANDKIRDTKKLRRFQALYRSHALSLPSADILDAKQAHLEKQARLQYLISRKSKNSMNNSTIPRQTVFGIATDIDILEECGFTDTDFDDRLMKPFSAQSFINAIARYDMVNDDGIHEPLSNNIKINIFIADTSQTAAKLHERILKSANYYQISTCSNGAEALERMITESFDVILIDMKMIVPSTGTIQISKS